jgi:hypothetical protein
MRFSLRTLVGVMLLMGPLCAGIWCGVEEWRRSERERLTPLLDFSFDPSHL